MSRSEETTSAAQKIHTEDENEAGARVRYKQVKEEGEEEGGSSALLLLPSPSSVFSSGVLLVAALPCLALPRMGSVSSIIQPGCALLLCI